MDESEMHFASANLKITCYLIPFIWYTGKGTTAQLEAGKQKWLQGTADEERNYNGAA